MMKNKLHIFAGKFKTRKQACKYTQEHLGPVWQFEADLGGTGFLDSCFIETITDKGRLDYVTSFLKLDKDIETVRTKSEGLNTFVLVFPDALVSLGRYKCTMKDTTKLTYIGAFKFEFPE